MIKGGFIVNCAVPTAVDIIKTFNTSLAFGESHAIRAIYSMRPLSPVF